MKVAGGAVGLTIIRKPSVLSLVSGCSRSYCVLKHIMTAPLHAFTDHTPTTR